MKNYNEAGEYKTALLCRPSSSLSEKKTEQGSDITRPWLYENYLSSTGTPVVNVTKATISAMNALSKFPRTNRMLSRNAKLLKRNIS